MGTRSAAQLGAGILPSETSKIPEGSKSFSRLEVYEPTPSCVAPLVPIATSLFSPKLAITKANRLSVVRDNFYLLVFFYLFRRCCLFASSE